MGFTSVLWFLLLPVRIPFRLFRWWLRFLWRPVRFQWILIPWRIILVALALIGLPSVLVGLVEGIFFHTYMDFVFNVSIEHFKQNVATCQWMNSHSVFGAPEILEAAFAPFHVAQIREPIEWWEKLGLKRFDIPSFEEVTPENDVPADQFARLDSLYRRVPWSMKPKEPWHHWIFASGNYLHLENALFDEWDKAFNELLQYHYANPAAHNATFQYVACPRSFLCDIWKVRGPSLVHFTTEVPPPPEEGEVPYDLPERPVVPGYDPVYVRVFEFPRIDYWEKSLHLPRDVFPSYFNQLRSVTSNPGVWMTEPVHTDMKQILYRLFELSDEKRIEHRKTFGRLRDLEDWVWDQIVWIDPAGDDTLMGYYTAVTRMAALLASFSAKLVFVRGAELFSAFFGVSKEDDLARLKREAEAQGNEQQDRAPGKGFEDMFWEALGEVMEEMVANMSESDLELVAQMLAENRTGAKRTGYGDDDDQYSMTPEPILW